MDADRVRDAVRELMLALGEDPAEPRLVATPARSATAWVELLSGSDEDPVAPMSGIAAEEGFGEQVIALRDIAFRSVCEHHLLPFDGVAHLMYRSSGPVSGLGSFIRSIDVLSSRLQLQERLTDQIADAIVEAIAPIGLVVVLVARHGCVSDRGARSIAARTTTIASRGSFSGREEAAAASLLLAPHSPGTPINTTSRSKEDA
ncbi:GTP cyclohydrolase I [Naasia lichenicola]|uniref:GTP cyclohydrolase 1 n=1 Tax=Naasia lichenicola TaxID=2565933 RepID=A0A4S4FLA8_9MICO|nr:GTP cyclohydrolase I FolE [Naasia lichenicola]THG30105.1 GTP cyclohydrolase I FolE [Naasia lichenicola]